MDIFACRPATSISSATALTSVSNKAILISFCELFFLFFQSLMSEQTKIKKDVHLVDLRDWTSLFQVNRIEFIDKFQRVYALCLEFGSDASTPKDSLASLIMVLMVFTISLRSFRESTPS